MKKKFSDTIEHTFILTPDFKVESCNESSSEEDEVFGFFIFSVKCDKQSGTILQKAMQDTVNATLHLYKKESSK